MKLSILTLPKDKVAAADYKEDQDPTKFKSEKTERRPLINLAEAKKCLMENKATNVEVVDEDFFEDTV